MVMKLNLPLKQKLGVASIFALGFVVVIVSSKSLNIKECAYFLTDTNSYPRYLLAPPRDHAHLHRVDD